MAFGINVTTEGTVSPLWRTTSPGDGFVAGDGTHVFMVKVRGDRYPNHIMVQRFRLDGTPDWGNGGEPVTLATDCPQDQLMDLSFLPDDSGGLWLAWREQGAPINPG